LTEVIAFAAAGERVDALTVRHRDEMTPCSTGEEYSFATAEPNLC